MSWLDGPRLNWTAPRLFLIKLNWKTNIGLGANIAKLKKENRKNVNLFENNNEKTSNIG